MGHDTFRFELSDPMCWVLGNCRERRVEACLAWR